MADFENSQIQEEPNFSDVEVKEEPNGTSESEIRTVDTEVNLEVREFRYNKIKKPGDGNYQETKKKYGPFAATDPERKAKTLKDSRFSLNPLLRGPLAVEEEEKRVIEERVRTRIEAVADEAKSRASEEGYKEGFEKGHKEAYDKFRAECEDRKNQIDEILSAIESAKERIFQENERFLIELVFQLSKVITLKDLETDKEYVQRLAVDIIERMGIRENITIRIHPKDVEALDILKAGISKSLGNLKNVNFEPSDQIEIGGCKIESQWNAIDATLETQIENLYSGFIGKKKERPEGEEKVDPKKRVEPTKEAAATSTENEEPKSEPKDEASPDSDPEKDKK